MKDFKYDVKLLIKSVKDRPCIWHKKLEVYKDRIERRKAWEEIFNILDDDYESLSAEEKRMTGELILHKWSNVRDTFVRSINKRKNIRQRYVFHDHLTFLIDILEEGTEDISIRKSEYIEEVPEELPKKRSKKTENDDTFFPNTSRNEDNVTTKKRIKKKNLETKDIETKLDYDDSSNVINFVEVDATNATLNHRLMNEDEAFFASLLPSVVKYNEDERLEFRIEVLGIMKRINENKKWSVEEA